MATRLVWTICVGTLACSACGSETSATTATTEASTEPTSDTQNTTSETTTGTASEAGTAGETTSAETDTETETDTEDPNSCAAGGPCLPVVVMGYWPPTNEMLRQWSQNPEQNPDGWTGKNWNGLGYDIYAFFPEFPPDGDPTNDNIGDPGSVGSEDSDLQVDYQDTSKDFWRIVDEYEPVVLLTTSRGGMIGWEVEAIEGGHFNPDDPDASPEFDWFSDQYGEVTLPTMATVDARSWDAITTYRAGNVLTSQLPMDAIVDAVQDLDVAYTQIDEMGTSGNYLSGFLGLHGLYYNSLHPEQNLAAGHIHVGGEVAIEDAVTMVETTMVVILESVAP